MICVIFRFFVFRTLAEDGLVFFYLYFFIHYFVLCVCGGFATQVSAPPLCLKCSQMICVIFRFFVFRTLAKDVLVFFTCSFFHSQFCTSICDLQRKCPLRLCVGNIHIRFLSYLGFFEFRTLAEV